MELKGTRTFTATAALAQKVLVKLSSGEVVVNTATATDEPVGVNGFAVAAGEFSSVTLFGDKTMEITAAGAIDADAAVYAAADGKVQSLPGDAGDYLRIGTALEAATADGDIIEVLPYKLCTVTTVS